MMQAISVETAPDRGSILTADARCIDTELSSNEIRCSVRADSGLPLFVEPTADRLASSHSAFVQWVGAHRITLDRLIVKHGGIVLRGFPLRETADFEALVGQFPAYSAGYLGGSSPRRSLGRRVLESTNLAPELRLGVHLEMAYMRDFPPRLVFFARQVARCGGETIIADFRRLSKVIPDPLREKLQVRGIRNVRNYGPAAEREPAYLDNPDKRPWNHSFFTESPSEVDRLAAGLGLKTVWHSDGSLTVINQIDAFTTHPVTGQSLYRNNIHAGGRINYIGKHAESERALLAVQKMPTGTFLGDGSSLDAEETALLSRLIDEVTISWPWFDGDTMILDNLQVAHGRNPYEGRRETQVALLN
jgi:alpha-ketoglutarate-dependent taurine dioxygenase